MPLLGGTHWESCCTRRDALVGLIAAFNAWKVSAARAADPIAPLAGATLRIAFIDPLSGPVADIGRNGLKTWQFLAEALSGPNHPSGVRLVVAGFDNKGSPQESILALKAAIDQGFRTVVQGNGSGVAAVLLDAVNRHNLLHPDRAVLYINYAAMDPVLTQEKCSFWHLRIDADTAMKTQALARFMAQQPFLQRVYLLNQNYAHGQQFSQFLKQALTQWCPGIRVVGDELHTPFQAQDFAPYVDRVQSSGAQALVTANWGTDLRDLATSLHRKGFEQSLYACYPSLPGTPKALAAARGRFTVYQVAGSHSNQLGPAGELARRFRETTGEDMVVYAAYDGIVMLLQAISSVESVDTARLTSRLSGMLFRGFDGPVQIRPDDHQLQKGVYVSHWQRVSAAYPVSAENTGYTFAPLRYFDAAELGHTIACRMQRP